LVLWEWLCEGEVKERTTDEIDCGIHVRSEVHRERRTSINSAIRMDGLGRRNLISDFTVVYYLIL
jgi:hypothetical protein